MTIDDIARFIAKAQHRGMLTTSRADGSMQTSLLSVGVMANPIDGKRSVALVAIGGTVKLGNLRARPRATVSFQNGALWGAVEGSATLIGPDDLPGGFDAGGVPQLLRDVFIAAGGKHDNWAEYDRVMAEQRRTAIFIAPERVYGRTGDQ